MGKRGLKLLVATAAVLTAGAMAGSPAAAAPAEGEILDAGSARAVPGSYIVALKSTAARAAVPSLAGRYGGSVKRTFNRALNGFAADMSEAQAKRLAADPAVEYVQANLVHSVSGTQAGPPSWGLDRIDQPSRPLNQSYTYPDVNLTVRVYVIDTGVLTTHTTFGGRARSGIDTIDNDSDANDCHGHGTHVAGTVGGKEYGVAKTVQIVAVKVLGCDGYGTTAQIVAGVDWAISDGAGVPSVANMSLGGVADQAIDNAVARGVRAGITFTVAAGNETMNACDRSPSRESSAITVAATGRTDARWGNSNYGSCVDIFAPGATIVSSYNTSNTAAVSMSGTSMASPHVAGAAALVLAQNPTFTPDQVRNALIASATPDKVTDPGSGSPNLLLYVKPITATEPPPATTGCSATNGTDIPIPDLGTTYSDIAISGCDRNASATATVDVHIVHTWRGDLRVALVAPDGTAYVLFTDSGGDSSDNLDLKTTLDLSSKAANGTWRLRAGDAAGGDTGYIDSWTLTL